MSHEVAVRDPDQPNEEKPHLDRLIFDWATEGRPDPALFSVALDAFLARVDLHGMGPYLALTAEHRDLPEDLAFALRKRLMARELWEETHAACLRGALIALADAGLTPIVLKGTALAYSHYPRPSARIRGDTDILIEESGRETAFATLTAAGFSMDLSAGEEALVAEKLFQKPDAFGVQHDIDLHWRLNSAPILARLFSHAELLERSRPIAGLGPAARAMNDVDAFIFGCVHRRLHIDTGETYHVNDLTYEGADPLTWVMDVHLLYRAMPQEDRRLLVSRATEKRVGAICADALRLSRARLGTEVEPEILAALDADGGGAIEGYLSKPLFHRTLLNLAAVEGVRGKLAYLGELLFPDGAYMRANFGAAGQPTLPVLYLRRFARGVSKAIFSSGHRK